MKAETEKALPRQPGQSPTFRTAIVLASLVGSAALVMEYGFRPEATTRAVLWLIEILAVAFFIIHTALRLYWSPARLRHLRAAWYEFGIVLLMIAWLAVVSLSDVPAKTLPMIRAFHTVLLLFVLVRVTEFLRRLSATWFQPAQIFVTSFAALIVIGAGLLMLPAATSHDLRVLRDSTPQDLRGNILSETATGLWFQSGAGNEFLPKDHVLMVEKASPADWSTALFTSTSAVCVTGLTVVSTGGYWSPFGQVVILCLIQLGGLGIMTFGAVFALVFWQELGLRQSAVMNDLMTPTMSVQISKVLLFILLSTFCVEAVGAASLWNLWPHDAGTSTGHRAFLSAFHAVSAFCNAGLGLYDASLVDFRNTWQVNLVFPALIIIGGLGFMVTYNLSRVTRANARRLWTRLRGRTPKPELDRRRLTLHTKLTLTATGILLVAGLTAIFLFETLPNTYGVAPDAGARPFMAQVSAGARLLYSWFLSVTARTAGFNTVPTEQLTDSSKFLVVLLMFIGASPGSTGGGIKTVTFAVIMCSVWSLLRNRASAQAFRRTIPQDVIVRSLSILILASGLIVAATAILSLTQPGTAFLDALFEATSAFGTVGLSAGLTPALNLFGRLLIIGVMFVGRVGPLTLFIALPVGVKRLQFDYAAETVAIG